VKSKATTVEGYLAELPEERRVAISAVREVIRKHLDPDFKEGIQYGMIGYFVPHEVYPSGYHCDPRQPLPFAALGSQKNYMSLYLMSVYGDSDQRKLLQEAWAQSGKKLNMGKACIRFAKLSDLPLDIIGDAVRRVTAKRYIAICESAINSRQGKSRKGSQVRRQGNGTRSARSSTASKNRA
jgi:hypothetical protein